MNSCSRVLCFRRWNTRRRDRKERKPRTYFQAWKKRQVSWHRSKRVSGASRRHQSQRGPSASSRAVGEPRRLVEILVPPIAPAGMLSRPCNQIELVFIRFLFARWKLFNKISEITAIIISSIFFYTQFYFISIFIAIFQYSPNKISLLFIYLFLFPLNFTSIPIRLTSSLQKRNINNLECHFINHLHYTLLQFISPLYISFIDFSLATLHILHSRLKNVSIILHFKLYSHFNL